MTTPQEEAERRYPENEPAFALRGLVSPGVVSLREAFEDGAEWQSERLGPLVEAARAVALHDPKYLTGDVEYEAFANALDALHAAAAALDEEGASVDD